MIAVPPGRDQKLTPGSWEATALIATRNPGYETVQCMLVLCAGLEAAVTSVKDRTPRLPLSANGQNQNRYV